MRAGGAVGAALVLAACGGGHKDPSPREPSSNATPAPSTTTSGAASSAMPTGTCGAFELSNAPSREVCLAGCEKYEDTPSPSCTPSLRARCKANCHASFSNVEK